MSRIYFVRHGQAGIRGSYDSLSELGRRQARLLGEHWISEGIKFSAAYAGGLQRQRQTAAEVTAAYAEAGVRFPEVSVEPGWNEFDLEELHRGIAPILCAEDAGFRAEYEAMLEQIKASGGAHDAQIHRRWSPCDVKVVEAWVRGRHGFEGESWEEFRERVAACHLILDSAQRDANIAVFTSATPIAIWVGLALDLAGDRVMHLAGALQNASYTVLRRRGEQWGLFTFNAVPHLPAPKLRTRR